MLLKDYCIGFFIFDEVFVLLISVFFVLEMENFGVVLVVVLLVVGVVLVCVDLGFVVIGVFVVGFRLKLKFFVDGGRYFFVL